MKNANKRINVQSDIASLQCTHNFHSIRGVFTYIYVYIHYMVNELNTKRAEEEKKYEKCEMKMFHFLEWKTI